MGPESLLDALTKIQAIADDGNPEIVASPAAPNVDATAETGTGGGQGDMGTALSPIEIIERLGTRYGDEITMVTPAGVDAALRGGRS